MSPRRPLLPFLAFLLLTPGTVLATSEDDFAQAQVIVAETGAAIAESVAKAAAATDEIEMQLAVQDIELAIGYGLDRLEALTPDPCWQAYHVAAVMYLRMWAAAVEAIRLAVPDEGYAASNAYYAAAAGLERALPYIAERTEC